MDLVLSNFDSLCSKLGFEPKNNDDVSSKCVLVTGCDTGLGYQTAIQLNALQYQVIAGCLFPEGEGAKKLADETSQRVKIIGLDVTSDESCSAAVNEVSKYMNEKNTGLHALVNNAGMCVYADFEWQKMEHCTSVINVNLIGSIRVTKHFLKLITNKTGRIVNVTSILGYFTTIGLSIYGATKSALQSFSDSLRLELLERGIQVCTVAPGLMTGATGLVKNSEKVIEEIFREMSPSEKEQNREKYGKLMAMARKANVSSSSANDILEWSISCIVKSVHLVNPRPEYIPCYLSIRIALYLVRTLPASWALTTVKTLRKIT